MNPPIPVVICDDSSLARKQMSLALKNWNVDITFAEHGLEALEAIRQGKGDLLFLDLNMPIMDGYQVLERVQRDDLPTIVLVVSGDIQPDAHKKVKALGAIDFIQKPINVDTISDVLHSYGLLNELAPDQSGSTPPFQTAIDLKSYYQEIANVAMGRAGDRLARLLKAFVHLPIPLVDEISQPYFKDLLQSHISNQSSSIVTQGFIGAGIAGEALLVFSQSSIEDVAALLKYEGTLDDEAEKGLLIDLANVLSGAFLHSLANQLDISFSQSPPVILTMHGQAPIIEETVSTWTKTLSIEIRYEIASLNISCDLLVLFSEDSLDALNKRVRYFE